MKPKSFSELFNLSAPSLSPAQAEVWQKILSGSGLPLYVLGRNKYAESVANGFKVEAFIDDYTSEQTYLGKPVVRMADLPSNSLVISAVVDAHPVTAMKRLHGAGVIGALDYFTLLRLRPGRFRSLDYSEHNQDLCANQTKYEWLYERLADETSRQTLLNVSRFRFTGDLPSMAGFNVDFERQYFEEFVPFVASGVLIDGGGFDGQTTQRLVKKSPDFRQIYYFEPNPAMMEVSRKNLAGLERITMIPKGLADQNGVVRFDLDGSASRISESGAEEIKVARLDDEVSEAVTFIKLDIEGAEFGAIAGAQRHITEDCPAMAICVYHDQRDFWRIPERVLEYNENYDLYLRHYTEGILETVMYFIPRSGAT
jgi:FkbM family methyltransferase